MAFITAANATSLTLRLAGTGSLSIAWGDGSTTTVTLTASQRHYSHTYSGPGQYTFALGAGKENVTEWGNDNGSYGYDYSDLPRGLTYFSHFGQNTGTGDYADLPSGLTFFAHGGPNTGTGDYADLPSGLTDFNHQGNNTGAGNYADLPSGLTYFNHFGQNTGAGNYADLPRGLTFFAHGGQNTGTGDYSDLPSGLTYFNNQGQNTGFANSLSGPPNVTYLRLDNASTATIDNLIKYAYARRNGPNCNYDFQFGTASSPTDSMRALADALEGGSLGSAAITFDTAGTPIETDESLPYNTLVGQAPLAGFFPTGHAPSDAAIEAASSQLSAGPEPTNTTPAAITKNGLVTAGTWDDRSNGAVTLTYQWQHFLAGQWEDVDTRISPADGPATWGDAVVGRDYRLMERASNDGGASPSDDTPSNTVTFLIAPPANRITKNQVLSANSSGIWYTDNQERQRQYVYTDSKVPIYKELETIRSRDSRDFSNKYKRNCNRR